MIDFDIVQPANREEALAQIAECQSAMPLAGGTNLLVNLKRAPLDTDLLVDLSRIDAYKTIVERDKYVQIGAGITFAEILHWRPGGAIEALMQPMAAAFAGPLIRNLATVGGNICDASPAADVSPPLLALDARARLERANGNERVLTMEEFFRGPRQTAIQTGELLASIELPRPNSQDEAFYYKLGKRKADAISIVSVAICLRRQSAEVRHIRIALGAVASVAIRARKAEAELLGSALSASSIAAAAATAAAETSPIDDFRASAGYRRRMVELLVARGLKQLAGIPDAEV